MIFAAYADGLFDLAGELTRCALGRSGVIGAERKREGDGATPAGLWPLREVFWRADRRERPATSLPCTPIARNAGWCDAPGNENYNRSVRLPFAATAESLWREDCLYDLLVVLGYNDAPVVDGAGSAIFLHLARPDFGPTEGCVALADGDLARLLFLARSGDALCVRRTAGQV